MRITVLGCGSSVGVPVLGNKWGNCDPTNPKNRRRRCSILVEHGGFILLVDASPDLREQLLDADVTRLDAVLFTHGHADHTHGLDDLRPMFWELGGPLDIYADRETLDEMVGRFDYMFNKAPKSPPYFKPPLVGHEITLDPFELGGLNIQPVRQDHGVSGESLGFIFNDRFAYSTDVAFMSDEDLKRLSGVELWIVDCLREGESKAHSNLPLTLSWIEAVRPERAYLTHMTSDLDYAKTLAKLPNGVEPAYDGLILDLDEIFV
jgi:phosphoribosyl 1,2-cyclic phosphate phosphodiesterase